MFTICNIMVAVGFILLLLVYQSIGLIGVYYGNRFGADLPWIAYPLNEYCHHPLYVGIALMYSGTFFGLVFILEDGWLLISNGGLQLLGLRLALYVHTARMEYQDTLERHEKQSEKLKKIEQQNERSGTSQPLTSNNKKQKHAAYQKNNKKKR
tara:strand:+ start:164 stop:622 length:459 start_codon:yes stop_codon:yes gene_type:complete